VIGFEQTATGYRATDEQVAYWASRDTCPACGAVIAPTGKTPDGRFAYAHDEGDQVVEWTAYSPTDCTGLEQS
jgi:hypothetical protein